MNRIILTLSLCFIFSGILSGQETDTSRWIAGGYVWGNVVHSESEIWMPANPRVDRGWTLSASPFVARRLTDRIFLGFRLGSRYSGAREHKSGLPDILRIRQFEVRGAIFVRYILWQQGRIQAFGATGLATGYSRYQSGTEMSFPAVSEEQLSASLQVRPGAAYRITDRLWLVAYAGLFSVNSTWIAGVELGDSGTTELLADLSFSSLRLQAEYRW